MIGFCRARRAAVNTRSVAERLFHDIYGVGLESGVERSGLCPRQASSVSPLFKLYL